MNKPTLILGASANPERYSFIATQRLKNHGHPVFPVGIKAGSINGETILTGKPLLPSIDTITLYVGPRNQSEWTDYILAIKPKRLIFNPGTENPALLSVAQQAGIECVEACTLVMLSLNTY